MASPFDDGMEFAASDISRASTAELLSPALVGGDDGGEINKPTGYQPMARQSRHAHDSESSSFSLSSRGTMRLMTAPETAALLSRSKESLRALQAELERERMRRVEEENNALELRRALTRERLAGSDAHRGAILQSEKEAALAREVATLRSAIVVMRAAPASIIPTETIQAGSSTSISGALPLTGASASASTGLAVSHPLVPSPSHPSPATQSTIFPPTTSHPMTTSAPMSSTMLPSASTDAISARPPSPLGPSRVPPTPLPSAKLTSSSQPSSEPTTEPHRSLSSLAPVTTSTATAQYIATLAPPVAVETAEAPSTSVPATRRSEPTASPPYESTSLSVPASSSSSSPPAPLNAPPSSSSSASTASTAALLRSMFERFAEAQTTMQAGVLSKIEALNKRIDAVAAQEAIVRSTMFASPSDQPSNPPTTTPTTTSTATTMATAISTTPSDAWSASTVSTRDKGDGNGTHDRIADNDKLNDSSEFDDGVIRESIRRASISSSVGLSLPQPQSRRSSQELQSLEQATSKSLDLAHTSTQPTPHTSLRRTSVASSNSIASSSSSSLSSLPSTSGSALTTVPGHRRASIKGGQVPLDLGSAEGLRRSSLAGLPDISADLASTETSDNDSGDLLHDNQPMSQDVAGDDSHADGEYADSDADGNADRRALSTGGSSPSSSPSPDSFSLPSASTTSSSSSSSSTSSTGGLRDELRRRAIHRHIRELAESTTPAPVHRHHEKDTMTEEDGFMMTSQQRRRSSRTRDKTGKVRYQRHSALNKIDSFPAPPSPQRAPSVYLPVNTHTIRIQSKPVPSIHSPPSPQSRLFNPSELPSTPIPSSKHHPLRPPTESPISLGSSVGDSSVSSVSLEEFAFSPCSSKSTSTSPSSTSSPGHPSDTSNSTSQNDGHPSHNIDDRSSTSTSSSTSSDDINFAKPSGAKMKMLQAAVRTAVVAASQQVKDAEELARRSIEECEERTRIALVECEERARSAVIKAQQSAREAVECLVKAKEMTEREREERLRQQSEEFREAWEEREREWREAIQEAKHKWMNEREEAHRERMEETEALEEKLDEMSSSLASLKAERKVLLARVEEGERQNRDDATRISSMQRALDLAYQAKQYEAADAESVRKKLVAEIAHERDQMRRERAQDACARRKQIEELRQLGECLLKSKEETRLANARIDVVTRRAEVAEEAVKALREEGESNRMALEEAAAEAVKKVGAVHAQKLREVKGALEGRISEAEGKLNESRAKARALREERDSWRIKHNDLATAHARLMAELDQKKISENALEATVDRLNQRINQQMQTIARLSPLEAELAECKRKLRESEASVESLQTKLHAHIKMSTEAERLALANAHSAQEAARKEAQLARDHAEATTQRMREEATAQMKLAEERLREGHMAVTLREKNAEERVKEAEARAVGAERKAQNAEALVLAYERELKEIAKLIRAKEAKRSRRLHSSRRAEVLGALELARERATRICHAVGCCGAGLLGVPCFGCGGDCEIAKGILPNSVPAVVRVDVCEGGTLDIPGLAPAVGTLGVGSSVTRLCCATIRRNEEQRVLDELETMRNKQKVLASVDTDEDGSSGEEEEEEKEEETDEQREEGEESKTSDQDNDEIEEPDGETKNEKDPKDSNKVEKGVVPREATKGDHENEAEKANKGDDVVNESEEGGNEPIPPNEQLKRDQDNLSKRLPKQEEPRTKRAISTAKSTKKDESKNKRKAIKSRKQTGDGGNDDSDDASLKTWIAQVLGEGGDDSGCDAIQRKIKKGKRDRKCLWMRSSRSVLSKGPPLRHNASYNRWVNLVGKRHAGKHLRQCSHHSCHHHSTTSKCCDCNHDDECLECLSERRRDELADACAAISSAATSMASATTPADVRALGGGYGTRVCPRGVSPCVCVCAETCLSGKCARKLHLHHSISSPSTSQPSCCGVDDLCATCPASNCCGCSPCPHSVGITAPTRAFWLPLDQSCSSAAPRAIRHRPLCEFAPPRPLVTSRPQRTRPVSSSVARPSNAAKKKKSPVPLGTRRPLSGKPDISLTPPSYKRPWGLSAGLRPLPHDVGLGMGVDADTDRLSHPPSFPPSLVNVQLKRDALDRKGPPVPALLDNSDWSISSSDKTIVPSSSSSSSTLSSSSSPNISNSRDIFSSTSLAHAMATTKDTDTNFNRAATVPKRFPHTHTQLSPRTPPVTTPALTHSIQPQSTSFHFSPRPPTSNPVTSPSSASHILSPPLPTSSGNTLPASFPVPGAQVSTNPNVRPRFVDAHAHSHIPMPSYDATTYMRFLRQ